MKHVIGILQKGLFTTGRIEPTTTWRGRTTDGDYGVRYKKMTIYKLSEFLFKEQGQLLLSLDLVSYDNLDKNQCAKPEIKRGEIVC